MKYQSDVLTGELVLYFTRFVSYMAFSSVPVRDGSSRAGWLLRGARPPAAGLSHVGVRAHLRAVVCVTCSVCFCS